MIRFRPSQASAEFTRKDEEVKPSPEEGEEDPWRMNGVMEMEVQCVLGEGSKLERWQLAEAPVPEYSEEVNSPEGPAKPLESRDQDQGPAARGKDKQVTNKVSVPQPRPRRIWDSGARRTGTCHQAFRWAHPGSGLELALGAPQSFQKTLRFATELT